MGQKSAQRHATLKIRVNDKERLAFEEASQIAGLTISAWVRMVLRERVADRLMLMGSPSSKQMTKAPQ